VKKTSADDVRVFAWLGKVRIPRTVPAVLPEDDFAEAPDDARA
jgi:hypothetical protein